MMEIHISDVRSFKNCRRRWNWSSNLRQGLEPKQVYAPFFTGRAVHYALQQYYEQSYDNRETPPDEWAWYWVEKEIKVIKKDGSLAGREEMIKEQTDLIYGMLEHYALWVDTPQHAGKFSDGLFDVISMETEFNIPIIHPETGEIHPKASLAGRFDGIIRMKDTGEHWVFETKTARSIKELLRSLINDEQAGAYLIAAEALLQRPIAGVLYNVLRKKVPTDPKELVSGGLSKNVRTDTTAEHFYFVAEGLGMEGDEIWAEYGDHLEYLIKEKGNTFFQRVPVRRTEAQKYNQQLSIWQVTDEMVDSNTPAYPSPSMVNCNWCMFRNPCLKIDLGRDPQFQLDLNFKRRREWDPLKAKEA